MGAPMQAIEPFEAKKGEEARDAEETLSAQMVGAYN